MTGSEVRKTFLDYFAARGHRVVRSSPLVPANDPTLLFTNAGMNQFKDVFLGLDHRDYVRATSSQKCMRAGGKHNDLENVGRTRRHLTFFEMLGNFSFGDYFKKEAIEFAWELVTKEFGLSEEKLFVTVFGGGQIQILKREGYLVLGENWVDLPKDQEAVEFWENVGVRAERIFALGVEDNFWAMGDTGPCGPCSEIHYDLGREASDRHHDCKFPCPDNCGRYIEIWNLVFMQFDRGTEGVLTVLPKPSIDTGMGLERMASVLQGKLSVFETDLLFPLVEEAAEMVGTSYGEKPDSDVSLRILADHSRAAAFLINDGILPANDGRGYVLRKVLRRAVRHGKQLGFNEPFLYKLTGKVAEIMSEVYPELLESTQRVAAVVKVEESRFAKSLSTGYEEFLKALRRQLKDSKELRHMANQLKDLEFISKLEALDNIEYVARRAAELMRSNGAIPLFPGQDAFYLYDTFGWPLDFIQDECDALGFKLDTLGFQNAIEEQRDRARASWKGAAKQTASPVYQSIAAGMYSVPNPQGGFIMPPANHSRFVGYKQTEAENCIVLGIVHEGRLKHELSNGEEGEIILDHTPFYAEAGGQVGDTGRLLSANSQEPVAFVKATYYPVSGVIAHRVVALAPIRFDDKLTAIVDAERREATRRNHTATHLLHAALRQVLGTHVKQAGSVVEPGRLRFDFSHFASVDATELEEIEKLANEEIVKDIAVETNVMELDQALETGAMAFFGEKYPDRVRVVSVPGFSQELCGGTHVGRTGQIGLLKITHEGSISAGVRRVEAVTGEGALEQFQQVTTLVRDLSATLKASPGELPAAVEKLVESQRGLERQVESLRMKLAQSQLSDLEGRTRSVKDVKVLTIRLDGLERSQMRTLADSLRQKLQSGVVVLGSASDGKVALIAALTSDLTKRLHAGKIAQAVAHKLGGTGGGRPDIAEAGGKDPERLDGVLNEVYGIVDGML